ncbi:MAG: phytanoyl-CoA dioxygenase family protein [Pseudomonadota bacterium]
MFNKQFFTRLDTQAFAFYERHGFVCLRGLISADTVDKIQANWSAMVDTYSKDIGVDKSQYLDVISQWRDLWKQSPFFLQLLKDHLAPIAAWGFGLNGVRLLHDHFIRKDRGGSNGLIPWHQDSMFWPVGRTGLSTWLATDDVGVTEGCLQVIAGSHRHAASAPVDFMQSECEFDSANVTVIPVRRGDVVLLNSKTWHRSEPTSAFNSRLAHLALWIPEQTRYRPEKASWHPLNQQVTVSAGELLNEDEFPIFGMREQGYGNSQENDHNGVETQTGMFNARQRIENFVREVSNTDGTLGQLLSDVALRNKLAMELSGGGHTNFDDCLSLVERVWVSASAYERHRSRNVFNSAYAEWDQLTLSLYRTS